MPPKKGKWATIYVLPEDYERIKKLCNDLSHKLKRRVRPSEVANLIFEVGLENESKLAEYIQQLKNKTQQEATATCQ